jgi:hypothetical protein
MLVHPQDANGALGLFNSGNISLTSTGAALSFYDDAGCSHIVTNMPINPSGSYIYVKSVSMGTSMITANYFSGSPVIASSAPVSLTFSTPPALMSFGFLPDTTYNRQAFECIPFHLIGRGGVNGAGGEVNLYSMPSISLSGAMFYSDPICTNAITSFSPYYANASIYPVFVRATTGGPLSISAAHASGTFCSGSLCTGAYNNYPVAPNGGGVPTSLRINSNATLVSVTCQLISIDSLDANGWPAVYPGNQTVTLTLTGGSCGTDITFYNSDCSTGAGAPKAALILAGDNRVVVGIRKIAGISGSCIVTGMASGVSNGTLGISY